jgi:hypothetical protein
LLLWSVDGVDWRPIRGDDDLEGTVYGLATAGDRTLGLIDGPDDGIIEITAD